MELPRRPISRSITENVEENQHHLFPNSGSETTAQPRRTGPTLDVVPNRTSTALPIALEMLELKLLRFENQQQQELFERSGRLPGFRRDIQVLHNPVERSYEPCKWHRKHPPRCWRPDSKALGLDGKCQEVSFHGEMSECCDWRMFRKVKPCSVLAGDRVPQSMLDREESDNEKDQENPAKERDGEKICNERIEGKVPEYDDKEVTYFSFVTDKHFAEASWPEIMGAIEWRKLRPGWDSPFGIERVVGKRIERTYTREEIEAGDVEGEEGLWWKKRDEDGAGEKDMTEKDQSIDEKGGE